MTERPAWNTAPIRCGRSKCKWRGYEGELMADPEMDEAVTYLVQRGLAHINEAGDGWHVILETDE